MNNIESRYVQSLLDSIAYPSSRMSFSLKLEFHTSFCKYINTGLIVPSSQVQTSVDLPGFPLNLENLEKSWKYHGILSVRKSGNPELLTATGLGFPLKILHKYVKD